ncbi:MAG: alpha amylase C-terminal domain-containing protein [Verrucomicrobiales bacterium]|nr:alpha amylase C-terminal domain-containing protein [Verrucomicrobiales bacterium]
MTVWPPELPLLTDDRWLAPWAADLTRRKEKTAAALRRIAPGGQLADAAANHLRYGLHRNAEGWVFREWAPHATEVILFGDMTNWQELDSFRCRRLNDHGDWELQLPAGSLHHGQHYKLRLRWPGGEGDRLPPHARRVVQDAQSLVFSCQVWDVQPYQWKHPAPEACRRPVLVYEAHAGMAQERAGVGTWIEFRENILPRIAAAGYNTVQLMAVMEHPYYGSFGYHVSNFFAPSSRFGTPEELKELIDAAHGMGLAVIMDLVHSHAVKNEAEGLSRFDGSLWQYFHDGPRGFHLAWDSRCFNYGKDEVLHFLLSNCRYWLEEFNVDGFRFDGVTSMLYEHRGLGSTFTCYDEYFTPATDEDALTYLTLANRLIHEIRPHAITVAEDVSGMPGLGAAPEGGGVGFDFRLAMGVPDIWFKFAADTPDEDWNVEHLYYELTNRRADEKTISYVESHDQSIVGGKTMFFQLADAEAYDHMALDRHSLVIDRALALHKISRLFTLTTAGHGYLNFIGNEFGHPEWVDFPREGNGWSYHYARRQWSLRDNPMLKYGALAEFDRAMLEVAGALEVFAARPELLLSHVSDHLLFYRRGPLFIALNLHPTESFPGRSLPVPPGSYALVLDSDDPRFAGHGRLTPGQRFFSTPRQDGGHEIQLYLPSRCALILRAEELTTAP